MPSVRQMVAYGNRKNQTASPAAPEDGKNRWTFFMALLSSSAAITGVLAMG